MEEGQRRTCPRPYVKDIAKYVMVPGNARPRHPIVEERTRRLTAYAETTDLNREELGEDTSLGIITSSTCYQYAREVFGEKASILKLGLVNPLPRQKILDFAAKVDRLVVVEELDPVIEEHCRNLGLTVREGRPAPSSGSSPRTWWPPSWARPPKPWVALDEAMPPAPGDVRRLSLTGTVLHPGKKQVYRAGRHRLLHPGAAYEPLYAIET